MATPLIPPERGKTGVGGGTRPALVRAAVLGVGALTAAVALALAVRGLGPDTRPAQRLAVGSACGMASSGPCGDAAAAPAVQRLVATVRALKRRLRRLRGSAEGWGKTTSAFASDERSRLHYVEGVRHRIGVAAGRVEDFIKTPGPIGPAGLRGAPGVPGPDGPHGLAGRMGFPGEDGLEGPAGREGREGRMGSSGQQGAPGQQGPPGLDGRPGAMGLAGRRGRHGRSGRLCLDK